MKKLEIGQEITIEEDFTLETTIGKRQLNVKKGDRAIVDSKCRARYITGEAKGVIQMLGKDTYVDGYDTLNISRMVLNRLNAVYGLEEYFDDNDIDPREFIGEIEDILMDIL